MNVSLACSLARDQCLWISDGPRRIRRCLLGAVPRMVLRTQFVLQFEIQASGLAGLIGDLISSLTIKPDLKTFEA